MLTVMREGFDNLNRQLSATEAFETFKGELEIAIEEESEQESAGTEDLESFGEPPAKQRCKQQSSNSMETESVIPRNLKRLSIVKY